MFTLEKNKEEELITCSCVVKHIPLPMVYYMLSIGSRIVNLCPTAYLNYHSLMEEYQQLNAIPPGSIRKHYSKYIQDLALEAWNERVRDSRRV